MLKLQCSNIKQHAYTGITFHCSESNYTAWITMAGDILGLGHSRARCIPEPLGLWEYSRAGAF